LTQKGLSFFAVRIDTHPVSDFKSEQCN